MVCITCPNSCILSISNDNLTVTGNKCKRGIEFAINETTNPKRSLTTTVRTTESRLLPVRTDGEIPKSKLFIAMAELNNIVVKTPITCGDIVLNNLLETGCNVIATATIPSEV